MAETHFSGPVYITGDANQAVLNPQDISGGLFQGGNPQDAGSFSSFSLPVVSNIAQTTATRVGRINIPNVAASCAVSIVVRTGITATGHKYDSSRYNFYSLVITRTPGAAAVAVLSGADDQVIATVSAGQTLTSSLGLAAVAGAVTALNTIDLQITNTVSVSGVSDCQIQVQSINGAANGVYITA